MTDTRVKGTLVGIMMLAAGLAYLYLTANLPRRAVVDAAFIPYVLAFLMIALGLAQTIIGLRLPSETKAKAAPDKDAERPSYSNVVKTLLLVAAFTAALRPLGFPIAAALYLFLQFIVLTPEGRRIPYALYAAMAIACAAIIFIAFRYGFNLILPAGPLTRFLP
jgi:putative tricarboxylic transport membrane protein